MAQVNRFACRVLNDVALCFGDRSLVFIFDIEVQSTVLADPCDGGFYLCHALAALSGNTIFGLCAKADEIIFQNEVDDSLIRAIAILKSEFFGENLDILNRFGWQVADFAKAGCALTVYQDNGPPAAAPAAGAGLAAQLVQQIGNRRHTVAGNIICIQLDNRRNVGNYGPARTLGYNDNFVIFIIRLDHLSISGCANGHKGQN